MTLQGVAKKIGLSIVVPFLNEEEGIVLFCDEIDTFQETLDFPLELVFVDDGSTDNTSSIIKEFQFKAIRHVKIITLSKNNGSHAAIRAGITKSSYDICTWMGSDLQEPLEMIPLAYGKICEGFDCVYVEKKSINVSKASRLASLLYARLMQKYAVKNYTSGGVGTIVFNSKIRNYLNENIESNSSIMLQIMDAGFKSTVLSLDFKERVAGKSKWTLGKKVKLLIDSFVSFSFMPIRLVSLIGIVIFLLGMMIGIITIVNKMMNPDVPAGYSTLISVIALGFGITNISLGIIAEYLWRTFDSARNRPTFIISETSVIRDVKEFVQ